MKAESTKEKVLNILKDHTSTFISGEEIAKQLFVTRNAVFKGVNALREQGYEIEAVSRKGYRLCSREDELTATGIRRFLGVEAQKVEIQVYDEVTSTNDIAREHILSGSEKEVLVVSDSQSAGRGRKGRYFHSPKGTGLYMSLGIYPKIRVEEAALITCMTAVAVTRAMEEVAGINPKIKWVNDIYYKNKKIAGILTEGATSLEDGSLNYAIVGIGINLYEPSEGFPQEIKKIAGTMFSDGALLPQMRNKLCAAILSHFMDLYHNKGEFLKSYREKSFLIGKYVKVNPATEGPKDRTYALVTGIDDAARLLIQYEDGTKDALFTGEVSVVEY